MQSDIRSVDAPPGSLDPVVGRQIMAFLQNMWVKNPDRVKAMVQREGDDFEEDDEYYA